MSYFKCYTHISLILFFLNTKKIIANLASHFGFKEGVDTEMKGNMNVS